jgi:hypothetical protein
MRRLRNVRAAAFTIALAGAALPALAGGGKQIKGVLEKVDVSSNRILVRETHGRRHELPLNVGADTKIETPAGAASLAALHVGDAVTVSHGPGPSGETAREIQVTKAAVSAR